MNTIVKLKSLITTDLARVSFLNGISTVIKMFTGLVSIKVISIVVGPIGVALLGQLTNFSAIVLIIANGELMWGSPNIFLSTVMKKTSTIFSWEQVSG